MESSSHNSVWLLDQDINQSDLSCMPVGREARPTVDSMISVALTDNDNLLLDHEEPLQALPTHNEEARPQIDSVPPLQEKDMAKPGRKTKHKYTDSHASLQEPDMAALLARLEMENNAIAKDPKSGIAAVGAHSGPASQFQYRVRDTVCSSLSLINIPEEALGMSLGDFWAMVTKDYFEALQVLPTMTPLMIHKGVPPFLRSVVWVGVAGARDPALQVEFDSLVQRLIHERPQNESIVNKDVARCFPQHDMFKDAEGDGQQMLGLILKAYSLYDAEIGYCQGMGFIVGILLMNMAPKDVFCVFVKLMESHGLRNSYSPTLSGLHSRCYQLKKLLGTISPNLLDHLQSLGVEMAYLSQWFMTIFATTCPLNTLFRIYDVIFAEGADETVMRVALALILSNEQGLLAMTEIEDVLHLLLGRDIWSPYDSNPDLLIDEITRLCHVVTREALDKLQFQFIAQSENDASDKTVRALGFSSGFQGFRFLDGWWSASPNSKSAAVSPGGSNLLEMPSSEVRRSGSKRSVGTIHSVSGESGSDSLMSNESNASTAPTEVDSQPGRDSSVTFKSQGNSRAEDRGLHEQVEGLLLALSEVQREAAQTAAHLQEERERKNSMAGIVFRLRDIVTQKEVAAQTDCKRDRRKTLPSRFAFDHAQSVLKELHRQSAIINTASRSVSLGNLHQPLEDSELQESLYRLCALLDVENTETPFTDNGPFFENDGGSIKDSEPSPMVRTKRSDSGRSLSLRSRSRGNSNRSVRQKGMPNRDLSVGRFPHSAINTPSLAQLGLASPMSEDSPDTWPEACMFDNVEEEEEEHSPHFNPRSSSLGAHNILTGLAEHASPDEALLTELVSAKTREAMAIQERDEMKVALDKIRRDDQVRQQREAEWAARLEEMERAMNAQEAQHRKELEKLKKFIGVPVIEAPAETSLWPEAKPASTPALLTPSPIGSSRNGGGGGGGGWGWFSKGRSVSTPHAAYS